MMRRKKRQGWRISAALLTACLGLQYMAPYTDLIVRAEEEYHKTVCDIKSDDPALTAKYPEMIRKWSDRLTGNSITNTSDTDYQKAMKALSDNAEKIWSSMIKVDEGSERATLWEGLNLTVNFQPGNSNSGLTADFDEAFQRIEKMATAYTAKGSTLFRNENLKKDIIDAMDWMYENVYNEKYDVQNKLYGNWWHWQIGMPQKLANITILMYEELPETLIEKETATLKQFNEDPSYAWKISGWGKMEMTSANLMDTALVSALRGVLAGDAQGLEMANRAVSTVLPYVESGDGFYKDGSCIQHSVLAYTGGYGATLLNGLEQIIFVTDDTPFAITDPNISNVYEWIWEGYRPLFAYGAMMDMVGGRGIARPSRNDQSAGRGVLMPMIEIARTAPDNQREEMLSFIKGQVAAGISYSDKYFDGLTVNQIVSIKELISDQNIPGDREAAYTKVYGVMDKIVHHTEKFSLGISMYSRRTGSFEYGNGENLKGWHMSDGALYLYTGDQSQYAEDYWPTVDPHRLAGITTDHTEGTIPASWTPHIGSKSWVGGSSLHGRYTAAGMDFEVENSTLNGKKSWFTFDDEIVALGAGISSEEDKETETIVENRKIRDDGANNLLIGGRQVTDSQTAEGVRWAHLEGNAGDAVGYYFPEPTDVSVVREERKGNWRDINTAIASGSANDRTITKQYVSLAVNHGSAPLNEQYAYVLVPNVSAEQMERYSTEKPVEVLVNTDKVQAVKKRQLGMTGINFWEAGTVGKITAKQPVSVITAENGKVLDVAIADPTQERETVTVIIEGNYEIQTKDPAVTVHTGEKSTEIIVDTTNARGASFEVTLTDAVR